MKFKTKTIEETQLIYSILRERHPNRQIEIEFNDNTKEYTLSLTKETFKEDPQVPIDVKIKVIYGDSVTGDTPLLLKKNNQVYIETISSIFNESEKFEYPGFKLFDQTIRLEKEYALSDYQVWSDIGWVDIKKVIRHRCDKKIYRVLTPTGCIDVTEDHSLIKRDLEPIKPGELKIGDSLLHSFPNEFLELSQSKSRLSTASVKVSTQINYYKMRSQGQYPIIKLDNDQNNFILVDTASSDDLNLFSVVDIKDLGPTNDYVYDIETEIGRFGAGIGQLQCLNTDSCFLSIKFNRDDYELNRKDSFKLGIECGNNLTYDIFKRPPIELEFEKVYQPFILLTKKRYIGKKFEDTRDPMKLKTVTTAGIALTRRDYCLMVKRCYKEIIDTVMEGNNTSISDSLIIFKKWIRRIEKYEITFDDLVVSAMLAKNYSCALCKEKCEWNKLICCRENNVTKRKESCGKCGKKFKCLHTFSLAHVNLAVKLLKRNEEIQVNDRIQYLFVEPDTDVRDYHYTSKKADLAEDPKYARDHGLKYNRVCYLEQLAKPILGFYKIILKDNPKLLDETIDFVNDHLVRFGGKKLRPSDFKIEEI
jgi:hypothetical protein